MSERFPISNNFRLFRRNLIGTFGVSILQLHGNFAQLHDLAQTFPITIYPPNASSSSYLVFECSQVSFQAFVFTLQSLDACQIPTVIVRRQSQIFFANPRFGLVGIPTHNTYACSAINLFSVCIPIEFLDFVRSRQFFLSFGCQLFQSFPRFVQTLRNAARICEIITRIF